MRALVVACLGLSLFVALAAAVTDSFCQNYSNDPKQWKSSGYYCSGDILVYCSSGYIRTTESCQYGCTYNSCDAPRYCEANKLVASPLCGNYVTYRVDDNTAVSTSDVRVQTLWDLYYWVNFTYFNETSNTNATVFVNFTYTCDQAMLAFSCYEIYEQCSDRQMLKCKDECAVVQSCRDREAAAFITPYNVSLNRTSYETLDCNRYCKWGSASALAPGAALFLGLVVSWFSFAKF